MDLFRKQKQLTATTHCICEQYEMSVNVQGGPPCGKYHKRWQSYGALVLHLHHNQSPGSGPQGFNNPAMPNFHTTECTWPWPSVGDDKVE